MSTIVQSKNISLSQEGQERIRALLEKLYDKHTRLQGVSVSLEQDEKKWYHVSLTAHWPGRQFAIQGRKPHLYTAVLDCVKRLNRALRKNKEKKIDLSRRLEA